MARCQKLVVSWALRSLGLCQESEEYLEVMASSPLHRPRPAGHLYSLARFQQKLEKFHLQSRPYEEFSLAHQYLEWRLLNIQSSWHRLFPQFFQSIQHENLRLAFVSLLVRSLYLLLSQCCPYCLQNSRLSWWEDLSHLRVYPLSQLVSVLARPFLKDDLKS